MKDAVAELVDLARELRRASWLRRQRARALPVGSKERTYAYAQARAVRAAAMAYVHAARIVAGRVRLS